MTRILAHTIIYQGVEHHLCIAEISDDGQHVTLTPFDTETANTAWVDGVVEIVYADGNYKVMNR